MKILICGSRNFVLSIPVIKAIDEELKKLNPKEDVILNGGAMGIDSFVNNMARQKGFKVFEYKPNYTKYGRYAPLIRDRVLVEVADKVVGIWDGQSKGTEYTLNYAKRRGKNTEVITLI